ncbi:asparagine synthase (glutamine-hydrolyzing) [Chamaesiphon sp. OTE_75_metabat_556]|uniref:asparagine synthase (glutamine-hydrolyzing) n=1 Tax=Chamaesiphon sp. OTE_75_metabat_556 TaxID=2964692 RepID=UPI00286AD0A5|nr:asparagine synthase (glutamine-hydrolyzing) [Chamaesiphon sp. OTE_75_metabat_556]
MCGLAGIFHFDRSNINPQLLKKFSEVLANRGPDDRGFLGWSGTSSVQLSRHPDELSNCWLGMVHRRLSILDLSPSGWQPMATLDGRYAIVFNGEIYNYLELQAELKALGYIFSSHSDTEVLLHAYAQWGIQSLNRLVGMFAVAILDTHKRSIFLTRDCFGIKPLYYTHWHNGFAFASEIKALLKIPNLNRQVNSQRLYDYLRFSITDYGEDTLFANIHQVPAAHYLEVSLDYPTEFQPVRYWQIDRDRRLEVSFEAAAQQLQELFLNNIRLHLRSDVPVGAALSGGIDSSSIVMAMRYLEPDLQLHTFSYIAKSPKINEEGWVDIVSQKANSISHKIQATPEQLVADLDRLIYLQDQPFGSTSIYAQHQVFKLAREAGIKVMLDGQGADEILGGYRHHLGPRLASSIRQRKWAEATKFLYNASKLPDFGALQLMLVGGGLLLPEDIADTARNLVGKSFAPSWLNDTWFIERGAKLRFSLPIHSQEMLKEKLHQSLETGLLSLLRYEDRNSMVASIESRVPFLTPNLVEFLFSLPEEYIIAADGTSKAIFRQAMRGIVPDLILDRQDKIGFATPELNWLTSLRPWVEEVLNSEIAAHIPALKIDIVNKEWQDILAGHKQFDARVWRWINLIKWSDQYAVEFE